MTDPDSNNWWSNLQHWFGAAFVAGGFVGGALARIFSKVRGPSDARVGALEAKLDQLQVDYDARTEADDRRFNQIAHQLREIRARLP